MSRLTLLAALTLAPAAPAAAQPLRPASTAAGPLPSPNTWAVYSRCGSFIFVMRGATPDETPHPAIAGKIRERSRELWHAYPRSGLYHLFTGELLWAIDERLECRSGLQTHHVLVTPTGRVVWLSHTPYGPRADPPRKPSWWGTSGNQTVVSNPAPGGRYSESSDGLGVRIIANGKTVGTTTPELLIADPEAFGNEVALGYKPWLAEVDVAGETLVLTTLDDQRITYDLATGEELDRRPLHAADGTRWGLLTGGVLLASAAGFALLRKRPAPALTPAPAVELAAATLSDDLVVTPPPPGLGRRRSGWHVPVRR